MLNKILKYEIKATARIFLPLYIVLLVFAAVHLLITSVSARAWQLPEVISLILYITILVGMLVMTTVVMIQRFYKNLLSDEGYLMFTLPVKPWKHIAGKLLISMMWTVISGVVAVISVLIIAFNRIFTTEFAQDLTRLMDGFLRGFNASVALFLLEMILACIIGLASNVLLIYVSIAIGHLFNQHRILASLGAFIVVSTVSQILFFIVSAIPAGVYIPRHQYEFSFVTPNDLFAVPPAIHAAAWYAIALLGLLSAGYFVLTHYILSRRLNLE